MSAGKHFDKRDVYNAMSAAGKAIMLTGGNNTHSGNISLRNPDDRESFFITTSGSTRLAQAAVATSSVWLVPIFSIAAGSR